MPHARSNALHTLLHTTAPLSGYSLTPMASSAYAASTLPCASAPEQRDWQAGGRYDTVNQN
jgi:hypothetical protein